MSVRDAEILENIILGIVEKPSRIINVFEWGSGRSTSYYTKLLDNLAVTYGWHAAEYDRSFAENSVAPTLSTSEKCMHDQGYVAYKATNRVTLHVFDKEAIFPWLGAPTELNSDWDDYIQLPLKLQHGFDLLIVDGRHRRRCLEIAYSAMSKTGITLLHDSFRPAYSEFMSLYPFQAFIGDEWWVGTRRMEEMIMAISSDITEQSDGLI